MEQTVESNIRPESNSDRFRSFLIDKGKLSPDRGGDRDERVFNAAMSCIELSIRPYERRLLSRALHDSDRLEALLEDRPASTAPISSAAILSPAEFREFVSLVEREIPSPGPEGPVPALFRTGAHLVAASYLWDDESHAPAVRQVATDLRVSLRLLDDLLDWVESGKREDRVTTLREAQRRMEELESHQHNEFEELRGELRTITEAVSALGAESRNAGTATLLAAIESRVNAVHEDVRKAGQTSGQDESVIQGFARDVEARIAGLSDVTTQMIQGQQEIVRMLLDLEREDQPVESPESESAIDQLRSLMLIGLVGIAVVAILVIVSITSG